ncbi:MAG: CC/Se motif family (seleno)protein [Tumebacillaceae bacterium]
MQLSIEDDAKAYILRRNKPLYIEVPSFAVGECCSALKTPPVRWGAPRYEKSLYDQRDIDGVTVYVPRVIKQKSLSIGLKQVLGMRRLVLHGY